MKDTAIDMNYQPSYHSRRGERAVHGDENCIHSILKALSTGSVHNSDGKL